MCTITSVVYNFLGTKNVVSLLAKLVIFTFYLFSLKKENILVASFSSEQFYNQF